MGVRAVVIDNDRRVLLVKHGYVPGWHLPGGGVEPGETAQTSVEREVEEETGVRVTGPARLVSLHHNAGLAGRDHVLLYEVTQWQAGAVPQPNKEIVEIGWFALDDLPAGTTGSTRARLSELTGEQAPSLNW